MALQHANLEIDDGEFPAVPGPTDQGETTLLQHLGGLDRSSSGTVMLGGHDPARPSEGELAALAARSFGLVFQTFNLIPTLTAVDNVETALVPFGVGAERRERALAGLAELDLAW